MRTTRVWRRVLGVEKTVIEWVELETEQRGQELLVARVRVGRGGAALSHAGGAARAMTPAAAPRRWRALDLGTVQALLEADHARVRCPEHGVVVAAVPWARPRRRAHPLLR